MILFIFVIPKFATIFRDNGKAIPWITKIVIDFSQLLAQYGWIVLLVMFVLRCGWDFLY